MDISGDKSQYSKALIEQLRSLDEKVSDQALRILHRKMYPIIINYVLKNTGEKEDANDVFQEGLTYLYKMAKNNKLNKVEDIEAYLYAICRNVWLKKLKKQKKTVQVEEEQLLIPDKDLGLHTLLETGDGNLLNKLLNKFGKTCFKVLTLFYYEQRSMKEIAKILGFANEQISKNKKSLCLKKLRVFVQENAIKKEDLL